MKNPESTRNPPPEVTDAEVLQAFAWILGFFGVLALLSYLVNWHFLPIWLRYVWLVVAGLHYLGLMTLKGLNAREKYQMRILGSIFLFWGITNFYG